MTSNPERLALMTGLALYTSLAVAILPDEPPPPPPKAAEPPKAEPAPKPKPVDKPKPKPASGGAVAPEMVKIKGGCFQMGSPAGEVGRFNNERPHQVCVDAFAIGKYEVTQAQWQAVMGSNPSANAGCDRCPVENVSWDEVQDYITKLNGRSGQRYRLPTEAEWEYACRGGHSNDRYCGGNDPDRLAWYGDNSGGEKHPVGKKQANGYGLHDMSGNVWEWTCSDYDKDYGGAEQRCSSGGAHRATRGGSWGNYPWSVRSAHRHHSPPDLRHRSLGFRLARTQ